jgi:hypothetical protein
MKKALSSLLTFFAFAAILHADLVLVQKVEGGIQSGNMTIRIQGDKVRTDMTPQISTISDATSGNVLTLMHPQKSYMRISGEQSRALMEQMQKFAGKAKAPGAEPAKLVPTGKQEKVEKQDTEIYTWNSEGLTVTYWVAKDFPNFEKVKEALTTLEKTGLGAMGKGLAPSSSELPGMPVKTEMTVAGQKVTSTLVSVKEEKINPTIFEAPSDYKEMASPSFNLPGQPPAAPQ